MIKALRAMPEMNAFYGELDGKPALGTPDHINLGIAIDLAKPDGSRQLLVPSIKGCEALEFGQFWVAYEEIVKKARAGTLTVEDYAGTTVSLTNPGTIGTVHSVPRLVQNQGLIIGVGAMDYPAEFQGASEETLARMAVSKVITLTSTYDHRVIQGAQSGDFLRRIHELLLGADGFYDEIFTALRIPYEPIRWAPDFAVTKDEEIDKTARVQQLIHAYRTWGHLMADIDPLVYMQRNHPDLDVRTHGLTLWDLDREFATGNRKHASYWNSTRDTAYAIEAIAAYLKASGELAPEMQVEVLLDGKSLRKISINRENFFAFDGTIVVDAGVLATGKHEIELKRSGKGALYANAYLEVFSLEDFLPKAGLEVKVERHVYKLVPEDKSTAVPDSTGLVVNQKVEKFRREPLKDGDTVASGDRIEVELVLESKNDYEYLLFSDHKPAGFEAIEALSGYVNGPIGAYMEPRDRTVDFFVRSLARGKSQVSYQLRAEAPGLYHALPTTAEAMYAPELKGNSDEIRLNITEAK
jgi:hypothetical protein